MIITRPLAVAALIALLACPHASADAAAAGSLRSTSTPAAIKAAPVQKRQPVAASSTKAVRAFSSFREDKISFEKAVEARKKAFEESLARAGASSTRIDLEIKPKAEIVRVIQNFQGTALSHLKRLGRIDSALTDRINAARASKKDTSAAEALFHSAQSRYAEARVDAEAAKEVFKEKIESKIALSTLLSFIKMPEESMKAAAKEYAALLAELRKTEALGR